MLNLGSYEDAVRAVQKKEHLVKQDFLFNLKGREYLKV